MESTRSNLLEKYPVRLITSEELYIGALDKMLRKARDIDVYKG
jgi:hypothetical protein